MKRTTDILQSLSRCYTDLNSIAEDEHNPIFKQLINNFVNNIHHMSEIVRRYSVGERNGYINKKGCGKEFDFKYKDKWIKLNCGVWKSLSPVDRKMEYCPECC